MKKFTRILTLGSLSSHRQSTKYACPRFHTLLAALLLMPCFAIAQNKAPNARDQNTQTAPDTRPILSFTAPAPATVSTDGTVTATLHLAGNANPSTLRVMLNNSNVTEWFSPSACSHLPCDITAHLNIAAGISLGWDSLYATLEGDTGNAGIAKARFYYGNGASNSANGRAVAHAMDTPSSRASVHPAAITAGTSATLPILPPTIAITMDPSAGLTLGSMNYPACGSGTPFSFFRFDRTTMQLEDQECLTPALMPQLIQGLQALDNTSIVFLFSAASTPLGQLNFSSVGGTDFTQPTAPTVSSYQLVGYGAATSGEAYESYQETSAFNLANIQGNLINAGGSGPFYGFQPTDAPAFLAVAGPPTGGSSAFVLTGYPQQLPFNAVPLNWSLPSSFTQAVYNANPGNAGFFVAMFSPTDLSLISQQFYTASDNFSGLVPLEKALLNAAKGTIVIMTSQAISQPSNPFGSGTVSGPTPNLATLCAMIAAMGGSVHACSQAANGGNGMFSFVGIVPETLALTPTNPLTGYGVPNSTYSKIYSSTYETGQNDSGSLKGLFQRDHQFHLVPYQVSSFSGSTQTSLDNLLQFALPAQVGSAPAITWPMTDTTGHQAAYAYLSNVIIGKVLFANGTCPIDDWCNDVRAWYAGSEVRTFAGLDLSSSPAYTFPSSATGFTQSDFNDVKGQLQAEFVYLNNELNYEAWLNKVTNGAVANTGSALSAAANEVNGSLISQYATITPKPLSVDATILNVAGGIASLLGSAQPVVGVVGNILKGAAAGISFFGDQTSTNPAVVQVADLTTNIDGQASLAAAKYNLALQTQLSNYFSGVRSDWFKLQTFGILTSQPSANGWYVQDTNGTSATDLAAVATANARVSFYKQLLPQYFSTEWMTLVPVQAILNSGVSQSDLNSSVLGEYLQTTGSEPANAWVTLPTAVNSTCGDYGVIITQESLGQYKKNEGNTLSSWNSSLGTVLLGSSPSSAGGLGNLNLSQNAFFDLTLPVAVSPFFFQNYYRDNMAASPLWVDQNCQINSGTGNTATPSAARPLQARLTVPPNATLMIQPSATRVSPVGSITVTVSVQAADSTVATSPTGTIVIAAGKNVISMNTLTNDTPPTAAATLKINGASLSPGAYSLTVYYSGDSNFLRSTATMNLNVLVAAAATTTTLTMPPVAYQGQNLTFQSTVTSAAGVPPGTVNFQDGTTSLGSASVDSSGNASISLNNLGLGNHPITAVFAPTDSLLYAASQSPVGPLLINPVAQDMAVALSASSIDVPAGTPSVAVKFTVSSVAAFSGQLSFACVGLPLGATCSFTPSQANLPASGSVSTNLTISQTTPSSAGLFSGKGCLGLFGFLLSALLAFRISRGRRFLASAVWMWALVTLGATLLSGCSSGDGSTPSTTRQTGTTNILVAATSGNVTRNVPLTVNIR